MEDMFSLGNVGLWRMASNGYISLTGEVGGIIYYPNFGYCHS